MRRCPVRNAHSRGFCLRRTQRAHRTRRAQRSANRAEVSPALKGSEPGPRLLAAKAPIASAGKGEGDTLAVVEGGLPLGEKAGEAPEGGGLLAGEREGELPS